MLFCLVFLNNKCEYEELEDTKGVIRIRKSKDRQHNDQRTNNDPQKIHGFNLPHCCAC